MSFGRRNQSGNVLFLILIAVALFAALSYVVTQSNRSGAGNTKQEKAALDAAALLQTMTSISTARLRLQVSGGYDQVRFNVPDATEASRVYTGSTYTEGKAIGVFDAAGGQVPYPKMPVGWFTPGYENYADILSYSIQAVRIGSQDYGTDAGDELAVFKYLSKSMCEELNKKLTGSAAIAAIVHVGSTYGISSQTAGRSGVFFPMTMGSGGGLVLPSIPVCVSDVSSPFIFIYDLSPH